MTRMENLSTHEQRSLIRVGLVVLAIIVGMALCALMSSCKTQYVEVEKPVIVEHTTVQHHTDIVRDTLMMRDSTSTLIKGDTTIIERWHHVYKVDKQVVTDTVRDSVPKIVEIEKPVLVEKKLSKWHQFKMDAGATMLTTIILMIIGVVVWGIFKIKKIWF